MSQQDIAQRYAKAIQARDMDALGELMHEDIVSRIPQSGETIRGRSNYMEMLKSYPGLPESEMGPVQGNERTAVIPSSVPFGLPTVTVFGGDQFIIEGASKYPNGETFHIVSILRVEGQKVIEETAYFAAPFEAPEWRRHLVELD